MNNKEIIETLISKVFNNHDLSLVDDIMREDYIQHSPVVAQGRKGFKAFFEQTFKSIPDFHYEVIHLVAEGNMVVAFCTNTGTMQGRWIDQPPTGKKLKFNVADIFRIQDGLIAEHWDCADTYEIFRQIGKI